MPKIRVEEKNKKIKEFLNKIRYKVGYLHLAAIPHILVNRYYPRIYIPSTARIYGIFEKSAHLPTPFTLLGIVQALGGNPWQMWEIYFEELRNDPPKFLAEQIEKLRNDPDYSFPPELLDVFDFVIRYLRLFVNDDLIRMWKDEDEIKQIGSTEREIRDVLALYNVEPKPEIIKAFLELYKQLSRGKEDERKSDANS